MAISFLYSTAFSLLTFLTLTIHSYPLSTTGRWITDDETGNRVKLACANWPSHLEPVVAEGLSKQPLDFISKTIVSLGFNCVRLTWPVYLATNESLGDMSVRQSITSLGLFADVSGFQTHNPAIIDLSLIQAFQAVVTNLGDNKLMVILDNHNSKPGWCCSENDGNGFFGDPNFDPATWIQGLSYMATLFKDVSNVVAMSLRNELRGPRQNTNDWYRYMQQGAETVHSINPDLLIILSGLNYDRDLSFLQTRPLELSFTKKLVFEVHWYSFSDGNLWDTSNPNEACGKAVNNMNRVSGFLLDKGFPLFMSEFGFDERGTNLNDNKYLNCLLSWAAEYDLDWAWWAVVGSYYIREGISGYNEFYGILDWNWFDVRNSSFLSKVSVLQSPFRGPGLSETSLHKVIFHPLTGLCVLRGSVDKSILTLGPCQNSEPWTYTFFKTLSIKGTMYCLQAKEQDEFAEMGILCFDSGSRWKFISDSKMHISSEVQHGKQVCLDVDSNNNIVTNSCKCLSGDKNCDPASQWFKLVDSTRDTMIDGVRNSVEEGHSSDL